MSVLVRFTGRADTTLVRWLGQMGSQSQEWHNFFFCNLMLTNRWHASAGLKRRFRPRSPAMALNLTDHLWLVHDLLHYPVPQVA